MSAATKVPPIPNRPLSRQQRRAAAREEARRLAAAQSTTRVDPSLMELLVSARKRQEEAQRALIEAQGALKHVTDQIALKHALKPGDGIDPLGNIVRGPAKRGRGKPRG